MWSLLPVVSRECKRLGDLNVYKCSWNPLSAPESVILRVDVAGFAPGLREVVVSLLVEASIRGLEKDVDGAVVYRCRVDPWSPVCTIRHSLLPWWVPGVRVEVDGGAEPRLGLSEGGGGLYLVHFRRPGRHVVQYVDGVVDLVYGLPALRLSSGVCCVGELGRPVRLSIEPKAVLKRNVTVMISPEAVVCVSCGYALCAVACGEKMHVGRELVCVPDSLRGECRVEIVDCGRHEVYTVDVPVRVEALLRLAAAAASELAELLKHIPTYLAS